MKTLKTGSQILLLTFVYLVLVPIVTMALMAVGFSFPESKATQLLALSQLLAAGFIYALLAIYLARQYSLKPIAFITILFSVFFLSNFSVAIEGYMFTDGLISCQIFWALILQQFFISFIVSGLYTLVLIKNLRKPVTQKSLKTKYIGFKIILGALTYMTLYYVWGKINYMLFTKPYYDSDILGLKIPETTELIKFIVIRGIVITLSVLAFLSFAMPNSRQKMIETGAILFLFGGLIPSLYMVGLFPLPFILLSLIEIFLQNFIAGIIIFKIFASLNFTRSLK